ncbi:MAG: methyltransferase domain-containing protein [bacterium]|nr:methyltransferase domain-containing protein [bacterium]
MTNKSHTPNNQSQPSTPQVAAHFSKSYQTFDSFYDEKKGIFSRFIDGIFRRSMRMRFEKVMQGIAPYEKKTVLDVGCGAGRYSIALALGGITKSLALDFAENMIVEARLRSQRLNLQHICQFEQADFMSQTIDETFDHSFAMGVLDYIPEPLPFVEKMVRLSTKSVMISFPSSGGIVQWGRKHYFYKIKKCPVFFYSEADIERIAEQAGAKRFTIDKLAKDYFLVIETGND